jgi:hypothetical protein
MEEERGSQQFLGLAFGLSAFGVPCLVFVFAHAASKWRSQRVNARAIFSFMGWGTRKR